MTVSAFSAKMRMLRARPIPWRLEPSLRLVEDFEREFGATLPADYREFLASYGGVFVDAKHSFANPTPFGQTGMIDRLYGFVEFVPPERSKGGCVREATRLIEGAAHVVGIGDDSFGGMNFLKCTGEDAGSVYYHDPQHRWRWSDDFFYRMSTNLAPEIERYLELRRTNFLPRSKPGYENWYLIARSFSELIALLEPNTD